MKFLKLALVLAVPIIAAADAASDIERLEESGESGILVESPVVGEKAPILQSSVLLIPDSNADNVGMYDPADGTYLGVFIENDSTGTFYNFQTPINAIQGPLDYIFVSDQISDAVYAFDTEGNYLYDAAVGENNIRGIDFRDDTLYITSGDDFVAMYGAPGVFSGYFIQDGSDPFDILFLPDGTSLLTDIYGSTDNIRLYDANGLNPQVLLMLLSPSRFSLILVHPGITCADQRWPVWPRWRR